MCAVRKLLFDNESHALLNAEGGRELGNQIRAALATVPPGESLLVDLRRLRHAGYRALHEILAAVANAHSEREARYIVFGVQKGSEDLLAALDAVAKERGTALPVMIYPDRSTRAVGKLTKVERDTLELVARSTQVTAAELRRSGNLATSSASNRLRRLYRLRLVRREERIVADSGGREFVYEPLRWSRTHVWISAENVKQR